MKWVSLVEAGKIVAAWDRIRNGKSPIDPDPTLRMRHLRTHRLPSPGGSPVRDRVPLLWNDDIAMSLARPTAADDFLYRNARADEVVYVTAGSGLLESQFGNLKYQAEILTIGLPFAHLQRGEVETALAYVERGLEIATQIGHHNAEVFAAIVQGKVAMRQGYYSDALSLFRRAESAALATGMPPNITLARCVTGTCYSSIGGPYTQQATEIHAETLELRIGQIGTARSPRRRSRVTVDT